MCWLIPCTDKGNRNSERLRSLLKVVQHPYQRDWDGNRTVAKSMLPAKCYGLQREVRREEAGIARLVEVDLPSGLGNQVMNGWPKKVFRISCLHCLSSVQCLERRHFHNEASSVVITQSASEDKMPSAHTHKSACRSTCTLVAA